MSPEPISIARDISIILMCFAGIVALLILSLVGWKLYQLVNLFKAKAEEYSVLGRVLLERVQETASTASDTATTVKGSADFISDTVVNPVVQVASAVTGARTFVEALFRPPNSSRDGGRS